MESDDYYFLLLPQEVRDLLNYFEERAGYISFETDMPIHALIKRLQEYRKVLDEKKDQRD